MVLNYIGSKKSLAPKIVAEIKKEWKDIEHWNFCDVFGGTGALSMYIAQYVKSLIVNDWEDFAYYILEAQFNQPAHILEKMNALMQVAPVNGGITQTYSEQAGRLFFTIANAQK